MLKHLRFLILLASPIYSPGSDGPELVMRGQIKLTLAGAERVLIGAKQRASALSVAENIAVVDDGGHLLGFARMDGARPASVDTAITKAVAAAT
ncbi:MAG TPA: heme-binding protein, partial [Candidatus Acidoferrum sp.]